MLFSLISGGKRKTFLQRRMKTNIQNVEFSFKTVGFFPKLVSGEKVFRIISSRGVRKLRFFRLLVEGGTKRSQGKEAVDAVSKDVGFSLRSISM